MAEFLPRWPIKKAQIRSAFFVKIAVNINHLSLNKYFIKQIVIIYPNYGGNRCPTYGFNNIRAVNAVGAKFLGP